jgi:CheY-like chemotaxis protein
VLLDALVTETVSMLRASLPPEITLQVERGAAGGYVTAEPVQLQQVLLNLIRNAVQASPRGGQVTVRTAVQEVGAHRQLSHGELTPGHYVRAIVADTGEGMAASTLAQVFRPFFTTRPAGTGLGLATVREIVEDHGGIIDVRSVVDHGSIFEVWLPLAPPPTGDCAETPPGGGQTVLVLDSDPSVMLKDEEMLAALGYEPVGFTSADAALAACSAAPGRFDAMLIDAALLGRDVALPGALRRLARRCPIMLISSGTVGARPDLMARSGARVVLNRPLRGSTLATALVQSIEAGPRENVH